MINYNKRNINILSFFVSLIIFFIIISFLKILSLKQNNQIYENINNEENITNNLNQNDITLDNITTWKIYIEKLNLNAQIKAGTEHEIINQYVGHYTTSNLIYGNIALKAYNTGEHKNYFANLKELEIGDEIIYILNDKEYKYQVIENIIIDNEEKYASKEYKTKNNKDSLVLITYVKDMNNMRRCVVSELKGEQ